ncbi:OmpA family protein [Actinomadura rugatobispora]|uniref:OmpA family protein n=1 Tax=Actinomadura rugatobispora TaxID=1994 RepID=A0ABW1AAV5_9ACTN
MPARKFLLPIAVPLTGLMVATGCSGSDGTEKSDPPTTKAGGSSGAPQTGGRLVKEGWFGSADGLRARVEIKGLERQGAKSVLRYAVTSMDSAAKSVPFGVTLLDPVGRKLYRPTGTPAGGGGAGAPAGGASTPTDGASTPAGGASTPAGGTGTPAAAAAAKAAPAPVQFAPGATQELTADFPPIPSNVQKVTVITTGTAGEFTGVPVTGTGPAPAGDQPAPAPAGDQPAPDGPADANANPADLYDITEGEIKDVTSSGSDVKMNLRTDVLFDFDSAKLSGRAKQVLDQAAQEIREKADPGKRPLTINGHTDSKGADDYNLKLSRERAEAVQKELQNRLGTTFRYSAHGKGEAELIAKEGGSDDAKARSRNRRVEISYVVRQQTAGATGTSTAAADGRGGTVQPAAFRAQDGKTVASRFGRFAGAKRRLDVKPFYRDGAYLVAVFELVNEGPGTTPPDAAYPHKDYLGGAFTSFSVLLPGGTDVYRAVRIGAPAANSATYVDPGRAVFRTAVNEPVRGFVYIPAPPGNPSTVVFDGGPFGKTNNVPVS